MVAVGDPGKVFLVVALKLEGLGYGGILDVSPRWA